MEIGTLRAWWAARQGLDGSLSGASPADALARTGWIRSVGGASPYLGLYARTGAGRETVDAAAASLALLELPSARGCTCVLPAAHFATGLRAGQGFGDAAQIATARKYLGVTDAELDGLEEALLAELTAAGGPLDPRQLKERLGDRVRSLGPEGKKRGQTTTLPLVLGRAQTAGRIRRFPLDGRLDRQRYAYVAWSPSPLAGDARSDEEVYTDLARLFFTWIGPASLAHFQWFSGLGAKVAKAAVAPLGLVPLEAGSPELLLPADRESLLTFRAPAEEQVTLVHALDGLALLKREIAPLFDGDDGTLAGWRDPKESAGGALHDLPFHAIVDRGRIVGFWDWDGQRGEIVWATFAPATAAIRAAVDRTAAWCAAELGDVRTFSLDSPESRGPRLDRLRARA